MRKFVTVLLMVVMLSTTSRIAVASPGGDGGGIVQILVSAFAKPEGFIRVALVQIVVLTAFFAPQALIRSSRQVALANLVLSGTLTLAYFLYAITELFRYLVYHVFFVQPYFYKTSSTVSSSPQDTQSGQWSASDPELAASIKAYQEDADADKEDAIDEAVEAALRDPEVAAHYLKFATPEVRAAVEKALDDELDDVEIQ